MIKSNDAKHEQLHTFINYCQKHPIDMRIFNELDEPAMNTLRNNLSIKWGYNTNNIYMMLNIYQHIYIFQFKDNTSLRKFILIDQNYNFDYDEGCITLNEHNLRYITFRDHVYKTNSIYTFDENTKCVLIKNEMNNNIYLRNDICKFINFGYNDNASIDGWTHFYLKDLPDKINQLVTAQQVFATLSSKL